MPGDLDQSQLAGAAAAAKAAAKEAFTLSLSFSPLLRSPRPASRTPCPAGMRCLKIPNTRAFHNITKIKEAQELFDRLQAKPPQPPPPPVPPRALRDKRPLTSAGTRRGCAVPYRGDQMPLDRFCES